MRKRYMTDHHLHPQRDADVAPPSMSVLTLAGLVLASMVGWFCIIAAITLVAITMGFAS